VKKIFATVLCVLITMSVYTANGVAVAHDYDGVSEWAKQDIRKAVIANVISADDLNDFQKNVTREEFCEFVLVMYSRLTNICGYPQVESRAVTYDEIFYDANFGEAYQAQMLGFAVGVAPNTFEPDRPVTIEEAAVFMWRLFSAVGYEVEKKDLSKTCDYSMISLWARDAMEVFYGCESTAFLKKQEFSNPKGTITREQLLLLEWRFYESFMGKQDILIAEDINADNLLLLDLGIVKPDEWEKSQYITVYEALETISRAMKVEALDEAEFLRKYKTWFGREVEATDFDNIEKILLIAGFGNETNMVVPFSEINDVDFDKDITEFEVYLYLGRMLLDIEGCFIYTLAYDKEEAYRQAKFKGLIDDTDMSHADEKMMRKEFYELLNKSMFCEYVHGGLSSRVERYIDRHLPRSAELG